MILPIRGGEVLNKNITFGCHVMQRNRSILHMIDPLIENGYNVFIRKYGEHFNYKDYEKDISSVRGAHPSGYEYLSKHFGLEIKHLDKVKWVDKIVKKSIRMSVDGFKIDGKPTHINIPFQGFNCRVGNKEYLAGNFLSEEIIDRQAFLTEREDVISIIHPGGMRSIVSPLGEDCDMEIVTKNNIELLSKVMKEIPDTFSKIIIKTHPVPGMGCDDVCIRNNVLPALNDNRVVVESSDLIGIICESKYIVNFGSSTIWWLQGGGKRWINIKNCSKYDLDSKYRRDNIKRADNWKRIKQNVNLDDLNDMINNYDDVIDMKDKTAKRKGVLLSKIYNSKTKNIVLDRLKRI